MHSTVWWPGCRVDTSVRNELPDFHPWPRPFEEPETATLLAEAWILPHPDPKGTSNADAARPVPPAAIDRGDGWRRPGGGAACGAFRSIPGSGRLFAMEGAAPDDIAAGQSAAGQRARRREARHQRQQHDRAIHQPAVRA